MLAGVVQGEGAAGAPRPGSTAPSGPPSWRGACPPGPACPPRAPWPRRRGWRADGGAGLRAPDRRGLRLGAGGGRHLRRAGAPGDPHRAPLPPPAVAPARRPPATPPRPPPATGWLGVGPAGPGRPARAVGRGPSRLRLPARRPGLGDLPPRRWRRLLARRWREAGRSPALGRYGDPAGYRPLREALAGYLTRSRGLRCTPEQVVVVSGSQQALDLLARVGLDPGDARPWRSRATRRRGPSCKRPGPAWCPWRWTTGGW